MPLSFQSSSDEQMERPQVALEVYFPPLHASSKLLTKTLPSGVLLNYHPSPLIIASLHPFVPTPLFQLRTDPFPAIPLSFSLLPFLFPSCYHEASACSPLDPINISNIVSLPSQLSPFDPIVPPAPSLLPPTSVQADRASSPASSASAPVCSDPEIKDLSLTMHKISLSKAIVDHGSAKLKWSLVGLFVGRIPGSIGYIFIHPPAPVKFS